MKYYLLRIFLIFPNIFPFFKCANHIEKIWKKSIKNFNILHTGIYNDLPLFIYNFRWN